MSVALEDNITYCKANLVMFSIVSTFHMQSSQDHISWREVQNKSFSHTPTRTKDYSSIKIHHITTATTLYSSSEPISDEEDEL